MTIAVLDTGLTAHPAFANVPADAKFTKGHISGASCRRPTSTPRP